MLYYLLNIDVTEIALSAYIKGNLNAKLKRLLRAYFELGHDAFRPRLEAGTLVRAG